MSSVRRAKVEPFSSSSSSLPSPSFSASPLVLGGARVPCPNPPDSDTFRFLISTDNHLGYCESDPQRKDDSFNTFEEILQIATANQVDALLLAGDLFHENKPSRWTYYRTVQLLRQYCFGSRNVKFSIVSDQKKNFPSGGIANCCDPDVSVKLPVFCIHGNHDDPAPSGSGLGSYSVLDLLHSCSLVNYFGKSNTVDSIENNPILLQKGKSKVALYGLGNIRDERLHRTFLSNQVKWIRPSPTHEWFNVLLVHQNRVKHQTHERNYVSERMLPQFMDFVVWGHEHECCAPQENSEKEFTVLQPGSSVATSLSAGETVEKKVFILEVQGERFRDSEVPLLTVRPFLMVDIRLSDSLDPADYSMDAIEDLLTSTVMQLIDQIAADKKYSNPDRPRLPLIRLRVDHTGFTKINSSQFGQKFVGKVANPDEILLFHKQRRAVENSSADQLTRSLAAAENDEPPPIHEFVRNMLRDPSHCTPLTLLSELQMAEAVKNFVENRDIHAISNLLEAQLKRMQVSVREEKELGDKASLEMEDIQKVIKKKQDQFREEERKQEVEQSDKGKKVKLEQMKELLERKHEESEDEEPGELFDDEEERKPKRGKSNGNAKAASARGKGTKAKSSSAGGRGRAANSRAAKREDKDDYNMEEQFDESVDEEEAIVISDEDYVVQPAKRSKRSNSKKSKSSTVPAKAKRNEFIDHQEYVDEENEQNSEKLPKPPAKRSRGSSLLEFTNLRSSAASSSRQRMPLDLIEVSSPPDSLPPLSAAGAGRSVPSFSAPVNRGLHNLIELSQPENNIDFPPASFDTSGLSTWGIPKKNLAKPKK
jgi:double-strand break repair protein MRE11